jgi:hypothetical protein
MTTLRWVLALAIALASISHLAKPSPGGACCERHRRMIDPDLDDIVYCPARDR